MIAKLGDTGQFVSQIQKYLSFLGYDLIVDGNYGQVTVRSVRAFQKKTGLTVDGEVGPQTLIALKASQKRTAKENCSQIHPKSYQDSLNINVDSTLSAEQYNKQITDKSQIYIHFTAGRSSAKNTITYWGNDEPKISTAFVIDGDTGQIYQAFHPDYWGWHLGVKGTNGKLDKCSIGIEVCAFGQLKKKGDKYYAWPGDYTTEIAEDKVYKLNEEFRGFKYFYAYSDEQINSLEKLINYLVDEYNIPVQESFDMSWFDYKFDDLASNVTPGIWTHVNVRKDKTDSYPDHRILEMLNRISHKKNNK